MQPQGHDEVRESTHETDMLIVGQQLFYSGHLWWEQTVTIRINRQWKQSHSNGWIEWTDTFAMEQVPLELVIRDNIATLGVDVTGIWNLVACWESLYLKIPHQQLSVKIYRTGESLSLETTVSVTHIYMSIQSLSCHIIKQSLSEHMQMMSHRTHWYSGQNGHLAKTNM